MSISVFTNYMVKFQNHFSYINEEGDFCEDCSEWEKVLNGHELISVIAEIISANYIKGTINIQIKDNCIYIEQYQPSGETSNIDISWEFMGNI